MRTPTTWLGRRSPSRARAVLVVSYRRLAARGGQPLALPRVTGAAPDIIELIPADHERVWRLRRKDDGDEGNGEDPGCPRTQPRVVPIRRRPVTVLSRSSWECVPLSAAPLQIDSRWRAAGPSGCAGSDGRRWASRPAGPRPYPDPSTARTRRSRIRAAVDVRSAGRIPGSGSPGHQADQRPARSGQARCADAETGPCPRRSARRSTWAAAADLARRIRFDEETSGPGNRSCENCERRTIERHGHGSGAASRGNFRAAGGHPGR
jgi:hypothetical protein